jgi:hypothetical protein
MLLDALSTGLCMPCAGYSLLYLLALSRRRCQLRQLRSSLRRRGAHEEGGIPCHGGGEGEDLQESPRAG